MVDIPALTREELEALGDTVMPGAFMARGRARTNGTDNLIEDIGQLGPEHVEAAAQWLADGKPSLGTTPTDLKAIRHTHHRLAQLLAGGMKDFQAARLCNYSPGRVTDLRNDPAFAELMAYYKDYVDEEFKDFVSTASALSMDVLGRVQEMLDLTPEKFTPTIAIEALRVIAPLGGHAPVSKSINLNVNADLADRLSAARRRVHDRGSSDALDS